MDGVQLFPLYALSSEQETEQAVVLARNQLANITLSPFIRVQSQVFLLYRAILGQTPSTDSYKIWNQRIALPAQHPMTARWYCSKMLVKTYLDIVVCHNLKAALFDFATELAFKDLVMQWQPQVLNYLRLVVLSEYYRYLDNQTLSVERLDEIWGFYAEVITSIKFSERPYRPTEAQDDWKLLQMLAFLFRAAGALSFEDFLWCPMDKLISSPVAKDAFAIAIRALNAHNPEKALWL